MKNSSKTYTNDSHYYYIRIIYPGFRGMGAEMLQPLTIVSIGGPTCYRSTLLVVPVMYHLLHRGSKKKAVGEGGA